MFVAVQLLYSNIMKRLKPLVDWPETPLVPKGGLEPPRPFEHNALNVACLPISPLRLRHYITVSLATCQEDSSRFLLPPACLENLCYTRLDEAHHSRWRPGIGCNYKRFHKMLLHMLHDGDLVSP